MITTLPYALKEVSGISIDKKSELFWMINDGGNKERLYGVSTDGKIIEEIKVDAKNHDWEDLTKDDKGNIYIGDFGNNQNRRKNLKILKIKKTDLDNGQS